MTDRILQAICDVYHKQYIGPLKITYMVPYGYDVALGLNNWEKPIHIQALMDEDDFIEFFKKELSLRHLDDLCFYEGYKFPPDYPSLDSPLDKQKREIDIKIIKDNKPQLILTKDFRPLIVNK